jgi:hypothetical protein
MRFLVSVQTPKTSPMRAAGDWIVDAESRETALAVVMDRADPRWWPCGSTWTVYSRAENDGSDDLQN